MIEASTAARRTACPACGSSRLQVFHEEPSVPVMSNLLLTTRREAVEFPRGALELALCEDCGFIFNAAYDPATAQYGERYEETQGFSSRFREFASALAEGWIDRYDLGTKRVLEIGCGKGEFLELMAAAGIGEGIGIDPGVKPERLNSPAADRLTWLPRYFTATDENLIGDAVVCRHTLEHIYGVQDFLTDLRTAIGDRAPVLLFELPDTRRVLEEVAFWDVYYEHTGYFTEGSLARLFERCGFEILDLRREYDDQYLILEARPVRKPGRVWQADDLGVIREGVRTFRTGYDEIREIWRHQLGNLAARKGRAVVWGASSKAVSFLAAVGDDVEAAVDINPHKHGMYMAGTGHRILAPADLADLQPDLVIAMNPVYLGEIQAELDHLDVRSDLVGL